MANARRAALVLLLLLAAATAGCSSGKKADNAATQVSATATTGVLRGLVVDDAIRPIAGANLTARGGGATWNSTSGTDGTFRIGGLPPGVYVVEATKAFHIAQQQAVDVRAGVADPPIAKFQLTFVASSVPFANVYKYDGFYECGTYGIRLCSNVNIATWIVVCGKTGGQVCLGNVTSDHSLLFQQVQPGLSFLQAELAWEATLETGKAFTMLMGGGTEEELKGGVNLPAFNVTAGPSPLVGRVTNHEGPDSWCAHNPPCQTPDTLNSSKIGTERALLVQIDAGPTFPVGGDCVYANPCGAGFVAQQRFELFTSAFYNYEPPVDWLFAETGQLPPPPQ